MRAFLAVLRPLGVIGMVMSLSHLVPIAVSLIYNDGALRVFCISMLFNFVVAMIAFMVTRQFKVELKARDGILLVVLAWTGGAAFATMPLLMLIPGLSFTDAYFETISGLTTTGATVLSNLDSLVPSLNMWRGLLVWLGGMALSCSRWRCCPCWASAGARCSRPKRRAR